MTTPRRGEVGDRHFNPKRGTTPIVVARCEIFNANLCEWARISANAGECGISRRLAANSNPKSEILNHACVVAQSEIRNFESEIRNNQSCFSESLSFFSV